MNQNVVDVVTHQDLLYNQMTREPQRSCGIYLVIRRAQGAHQPTCVVAG